MATQFFAIVYRYGCLHGEHMPDVTARDYEQAYNRAWLMALERYGSANIIRIEVGSR